MSFPQRRILTVLSLVQVVGGIGNGAGLAIGALLVKDVSGSSGWAGTATVMLTLGAAAATIPLSRLAMRSGRRPALTLGWLGGSCGAVVAILGAEADTLPLVLLGLVLFGSSTAANLQSRFAAADRAEPEHVGRSLSIVVWSTTVGAVAGPNLTAPGARVAESLDVPDLAGPLVFSVVAFAMAAAVTWIALRPDPLEGRSAPTDDTVDSGGGTYPQGPVLTAVGTIAASHAVMVAVMSLTPVHMEDHGASLEVIGVTISLHIAGMFAFSPVFGALSDRWGPRPVIVLGQAVLVTAAAVAGTAGHSEPQITIGLTLLGLGWSASVIAGAALLTASVPATERPAVQGFSDLAMNLAGAAGGLLAGLVMATSGFGTLNVAAAALTLPVVLVVLAGRRAAAELAAAGAGSATQQGVPDEVGDGPAH